MKTNEYNFQLLVTNVQALTKEQEALNIYIPNLGKTQFIFQLAINVKKDYPHISDSHQTDFRHHFKEEMADANYSRITLEKFKSQYSQLLAISELIQQTPEEATKNQINSILSGSIVPFEQILSDLFNLLIIEYALNEQPEYIDLVTSSIKVVRTIQHLNSLRTKNDIVEYYHDSKVILPDEIFPLKRENKTLANSNVDTSYESQLKHESKILSEIDRLYTLRNDVEYCHELKINEFRSRTLTLEAFCAEYNQDLQRPNDDGSKPLPIPPCEKAYESYLQSSNLEYIDIECISNKTSAEAINGLGFKDPGRINVRFILRAIDQRINQLAGQIENTILTNKIVRIGNSVISVNQDAFEKQICSNEARLSHCELLQKLRSNIPEKPLVRILGIGHHQVIRDEHKKYISTSLAHNEPILQGELKESIYRNLKRTELYSETETEREEENSTDTKTKESFELGKEIANDNSQSQKFDAGVKVTASYPQVKVTATANYATQNASQEKRKSSVKNAKETVSRSINKVKEKVREFRSSKTINEIERTITHKVDNSSNTQNPTPTHVNGWYQYIDEVREFGVYDLGVYTVLRINLPVPAAFDVYAASQAVPEGVTIEKPISPSQYESSYIKHLKSYKDITRHNFGYWAAVYDAQDMETPPEEYLTVSKAYSLQHREGAILAQDHAYNDLILENGYEASTAVVSLGFSSGSGRYLAGRLGNKPFGGRRGGVFNVVLDGEDKLVPLSFRGYFTEYHMNVEVTSKLTTQKYTEWKLGAYNSIMNAYRQKKAAYDNQMSVLEIQEGIKIEGKNPRINKKIIDTAIERGCIDMLTKGGYRGYETVKYARTGEPETDYAEVMRQTPFLEFFNNAFEWHNKTFVFKDWYWDSYPRWKVLMQFTDPDMLFQNFIQAGAAIVDIPIRPAYTQAVLNFLSTGEIWEFQNMPTLNDPMHLSIIQMIKDDQKQTGGTLVGQKWEAVIPTAEVIVKDPPPGI